MTDQIGRVLGGRYRLLSPLGSGASAQVYLAEDVRLRRRVAVKLLHPGLADDESFLRRFRAEAQATAALSHPHLLAVYDWSDDEVPYLVTEYLGGGSLRSMLDKGHRLAPAQALVVGLEAARALDYAHRQGFVHRDIKPANLLFGSDSRLRVADFGLARAIAEAGWTEPAGAVLGTARYASPEQARGESVDGRSDVYSLALVMVESVTGVVPFTADTTIGTLMARLDHSLEVPDELGPLAPIVAGAGRLDPADRLDAAALGKGLVGAATELRRPEPLPLTGAGEPDTLAAVVTGPAPTGATTVVERSPAGEPGAWDATNVMGAVPPRPPIDAPPAPRPWDTGHIEPRPGLSAGDRSVRRLMLGAVVVAIAVVFGVVGAAAYMQASIPSHTVPATLVGAQYDDALKVVEPFKWNVVAERTRQDGTVVGQVLASNPAAGERLKEGKKLVLTVSDGPTLVQPPDGLIGKTQEEATAMLAGVQLGVEFVPQENNDAPEGTVIGFADNGPPADGFPKGSTVRLLVASDQEPEIPDLVGVPYQEAVDRLQGLGLNPQLEAREPRGDEQPGTVVSTDPEAGTEVQRGDTVEVLVAIDKVVVPSVQGMSLDEARATLQAAGLEVGHVFGPDRATVQFTAPGAGSEVDVGTEVSVIMFGGRRRD